MDTKNSSGMMNGLPPTSKEDKKVGPIIGALIIILIIIIAVLFFFGQRLNTQDSTIPATDQSINTDNNTIRNEANLSSSLEVEDLEADLDAQLKDVDYSF